MIRKTVAHEYILAIEPAILGGSISLFQGAREIGMHLGSGGISRSEDLLANIFGLLNRSGVEKGEIGNIVVSRGPGSFTGLRIGIATGLGLARAWNIPVQGILLFDALDSEIQTVSNRVIAVPVGKRDIAWKMRASDHEEVRAAPAGVFASEMRAVSDATIFCYPSLRETAESAGHRAAIIDLSENLAAILAKHMKVATRDVTPYYLSNSSFA